METFFKISEFQLLAFVVQVIALIVNFQTYHKKEMAAKSKKFKDVAHPDPVAMFIHFWNGRKVETLIAASIIFLVGLVIYLPMTYELITELAKLCSSVINGMEISTDLFIISNMIIFVFFGKLWFLKKFDSWKSETTEREA